jgi:hypothetical protein
MQSFIRFCDGESNPQLNPFGCADESNPQPYSFLDSVLVSAIVKNEPEDLTGRQRHSSDQEGNTVIQPTVPQDFLHGFSNQNSILDVSILSHKQPLKISQEGFIILGCQNSNTVKSR